jgi:hypothetical protein
VTFWNGPEELVYKCSAGRGSTDVASEVNGFVGIVQTDRRLNGLCRTLSTLRHPWRKYNLSCYGVVENNSKFPPSYKERSQELFQKYHPYETSTDLPFDVKVLDVPRVVHSGKFISLTETWL